MCGNWREVGVHFRPLRDKLIIGSIDFPIAEHWVESSMGALDLTMATYGFDTKPEVVDIPESPFRNSKATFDGLPILSNKRRRKAK